MTTLGIDLMPGGAVAQTAKDIVGTWKQVTNINIAPDGRRSEPFGSNPNAIITFDANGRFVTVTTRPDVPKFASNNRMQGTAEENKAMVQGGIAYFGTYGPTLWLTRSSLKESKAVLGQTGPELNRSAPSSL